MRKVVSLVLALVFSGLASNIQASAASAEPRAGTLASQTVPKQLHVTNVGLTLPPFNDPLGQIAVCANYAAIRAQIAKASGSSFAIQDRVLNLTFLLCMHGTPESD